MQKIVYKLIQVFKSVGEESPSKTESNEIKEMNLFEELAVKNTEKIMSHVYSKLVEKYDSVLPKNRNTITTTKKILSEVNSILSTKEVDNMIYKEFDDKDVDIFREIILENILEDISEIKENINISEEPLPFKDTKSMFENRNKIFLEDYPTEEELNKLEKIIDEEMLKLQTLKEELRTIIL